MARVGWSRRGVRQGTLLALGMMCCAIASAAPLVTRHASFEPLDWPQVPGWSAEDHADALRTFRRACASLGSRREWQSACERARASGEADASAARRFFESQFIAYRVDGRDERRGQAEHGLLTGYFEPVLSGRATRGGTFVHPVYGPPVDMVHLDARTIPRGSTRLRLARHGNEMQIAADGPYVVDVSTLGGPPMDQRHRLRLDGQRAVGYWSRQEIETGAGLRAPVLAWVDDLDALYVMQVQGSGRIRMGDGRQIRVAYADQNGHPFTPRGTAAGVRTRGIDGSPLPSASDDVDPSTLPEAVRSLIDDEPDSGNSGAGEATGSSAGAGADASVRTRGIRRKADDASVDRMVEQLLAQRAPQRGSRSGTAAGAAAPTASAAPGAGTAGIGLPTKDASRRALAALAFLVNARRLDRSYVFFREGPRTEGGPQGALGVPLTAGRSIAVDPRVTPLGAPVFIEATPQEGGGSMRRLMFAQDTGGAIRGAVRADFFWGSGPGAGARALQTRDRLSMWVLLPRSLAFGRPAGVRTRGIDDDDAPDCVIDDPDFCGR